MLLAACGSANEAEKTSVETTKRHVVNSEPAEGGLTFDSHEYEYDVVSGATESTIGTKPKPLYDYDEKLKKIFWSNQPPLGLLVGNYYTNTGTFDVGNKGIVEIVTDDQGKILNVEFNEYAADDYYDNHYAGVNKRLSDYAFFQARNPRTDTTLATVVNGITFVEKQMREQNRVTGNFETVNGSSTTAREGLMVIAAELDTAIKTPSESTYYGYAEELENGLIGRLQLVTKAGKIESVKYDEYFADQPEKMSDENLKKYYRQSKYHSIEYNEATKNDFIQFADTLTKDIIEQQKLTIDDEQLKSHPSYPIYEKLAQKIHLNES